MTGIGSTELAKFQAGQQLNASRTIKAKCAHCQKNYVAGKKDCEAVDCPCHPYMPYNVTTPRKKSEIKAEAAAKRFGKKQVEKPAKPAKPTKNTTKKARK